MILTAKYVFPVTSLPILDAGVCIEGNKIVEVGKSSDLKRHHPNDEVKELGNAAILPGFVNTHTRVERTLLRGLVADEPYSAWLFTTARLGMRLSAQDKRDAALLGCLEAIRSGTTTISDVAYGDGAIEAADKIGLRGVIYRATGAADASRVDFAIRQAHQDILDWNEKYEGGLLQFGLSPNPVYETHPKVYREIARLGRKLSVPIKFQLAGSKEEDDFVRRGKSVYRLHDPGKMEKTYADVTPWLPFGVSPVKFVLNWGAFEADNISIVHGIHVDEEDISDLKEFKVGICSCPGSEAQLGMGASPIVSYLKEGMSVGFGTDSPAATEACDMLNEMRFAMLLSRAITASTYIRSSTALRIGTMGGAKVLHMEDKIGSLEPGKLADITVCSLENTKTTIDLNPTSSLVNKCVGGDILMTIIDGKIVYNDGEFAAGIDLDALRKRLLIARAKVTEPL